MEYTFDITNFKKYFHYGLNYKQEDILDAIIIKSAQLINREKDRFEKNILECTMDEIKNLYVQFERFVNLTSSTTNKWYNKVNKQTVNNTVVERIENLKQNDLISVSTYKPMWGIYVTDRAPAYYKKPMNGQQRYDAIEDWIKEDVMPILMYLSNLEKSNPYQYNSLFFDTKYARSINSGNKENAEKIKLVYSLFMEMVKPAKEDVRELLSSDLTKQQENYIKESCADYWTITDLKERAKTDKYIEKVYQESQKIKKLKSYDKMRD